MARPLRLERADAWYHVTARGNERRPIYNDDRDRYHCLELLGEASERFALSIFCYVLMDNHYHLLLQTRRPNLSAAMQWLGVSYSVWFNRRHERVGHLFQGRFKAVIVEPVTWGLALSRYVHLNPVRLTALGLGKEDRRKQRLGIDDAPKSEEIQERLKILRRYRWSSYPAYTGAVKAPGWLAADVLLEHIGHGSREERINAYRQYVSDAIREGAPSSPWEKLKGQVALGSDEFFNKIRKLFKGNAKEQPLKQLRERLGWQELVKIVERDKKQRWAEFAERRGDWGRDICLHLAVRHCGWGIAELARLVNMEERTVQKAISRFAQRLKGDPPLRKTTQRLMDEMSYVGM